MAVLLKAMRLAGCAYGMSAVALKSRGKLNTFLITSSRILNLFFLYFLIGMIRHCALKGDAMFSKLTKRHYLIGLGILIILIASGVTLYQTVYLPAQMTDEPDIQTSVVRQGDLIIYASGSGTLIVLDEVDLGFGTSGVVAEIHVQAGDKVQEGDVLAVQGDRDQLEAAVASDQLTVLEAQKTLDDLYANAALVAAEALLELGNAQEALADAQGEWIYQQEGNRASEVTLEAAKAALAVAEASMQDAWDKYTEMVNKNADEARIAQAYVSYSGAYQEYRTALGSLNWYLSAPSETEQIILDAEVAIAQSNLDAAQIAYDRVKDGPDPDEVAMAELQLADAQAQLAVSQRNLEESTIVAPMDGTILSVSADVGDSVSAPFITMADLSQLYLDIYLDESDMSSIAVGYAVEVIFDALPDLVFTGEVVQIDPTLYSSGQISAVKGLAKLDDASVAMLDNLLLGMNASVDVIGGRAEGVPLVPVEALRELSPGEYAVFVVDENGELELRPVEVGLMDITFAEIKSGLDVGEVVSTGIVETE